MNFANKPFNLPWAVLCALLLNSVVVLLPSYVFTQTLNPSFSVGDYTNAQVYPSQNQSSFAIQNGHNKKFLNFTVHDFAVKTWSNYYNYPKNVLFHRDNFTQQEKYRGLNQTRIEFNPLDTNMFAIKWNSKIEICLQYHTANW